MSPEASSKTAFRGVVAEVNRYRATAELDGKSWLVRVEDDGSDRYTSVRPLRDVEVYGRALVVSVLDADPQQVAVDVKSPRPLAATAVTAVKAPALAIRTGRGTTVS